MLSPQPVSSSARASAANSNRLLMGTPPLYMGIISRHAGKSTTNRLQKIANRGRIFYNGAITRQGGFGHETDHGGADAGTGPAGHRGAGDPLHRIDGAGGGGRGPGGAGPAAPPAGEMPGGGSLRRGQQRRRRHRRSPAAVFEGAEGPGVPGGGSGEDDARRPWRRPAASASAAWRWSPFDPADADQHAWVLGADAVIDAIFGVGLSRPIGEGTAFAAAVDWINESRGAVVAADIASGVTADTGGCAGPGRPGGPHRHLHPAQARPGGGGGGRPLRRRDGAGHRHPGGPDAGADLSRPDGGAGIRPRRPAAPEGRRPQGHLRQGADRGRRRWLHRRTVSGRRGGGADRVRAGLPGGPGVHLAGGGGQVCRRHALPPRGQAREALSQGTGRAAGALRRL